MLINLNEVRGFDIEALDGPIGKASDFFFDDVQWAVRYLVVDTGWLFGRKVLIAPEAIDVDAGGAKIAVALAKQEIEDGPGIGTDLPVSRREEKALRNHFGWPAYWDAYPVGLPPVVPPVTTEGAFAPVQSGSAQAAVLEAGDPHLRSLREVVGYHINARDDEIGHVDDFVVDETDWTIRYLVVDTRNWLPGRKVVLSPNWATGIDWSERLLNVDLDRNQIESSPTYDPAHHLDREYERRLHTHYGHIPYWD